MSTVLYEDEKFLEVYQSMYKWDQSGYAILFGYPNGWRNPSVMQQIHQNFINNLRVANIRAHNTRYDENEEEDVLLDFGAIPRSYSRPIEFYQSLCGLRYNLDAADVNGYAEILGRLIGMVGFHIISELPEWAEFDTW